MQRSSRSAACILSPNTYKQDMIKKPFLNYLLIMVAYTVPLGPKQPTFMILHFKYGAGQ